MDRLIKPLHRRDLLKHITVASVGAALGNAAHRGTSAEPSDYDLMREVTAYRKIDAHDHVHLSKGSLETHLEWAQRLGIDRLVISNPVIKGPAPPEEVTSANDQIIEAMKKCPDTFIGQCFVNPAFPKEALQEIDRCVDAGMVGLKAYTQVKINDSRFYPIVEKCIDLKMIILMHAECQLGVGGYRMKYDIHRPPSTSIPEDFVDIAARYPEALFQYAHIGGGFDWEYACKMLRETPNVWVDTSGSNNEEFMIDFALKTLGGDRILFGSDGSYYQSVGKVLASNASETQKKKIFFDNYNDILKRVGRHVG